MSDTYFSEEPSIEIIPDLEEVILNINQAITCSLLLNELVVNAFKHAFKEGEQGTIKVFMSKSGNEVTLVVKASGEGFQDLGSPETLGRSLIDTLSGQLEGELELNNTNGAEVTVRFEAEMENSSSSHLDPNLDLDPEPDPKSDQNPEKKSRSANDNEGSRLW
jgi:two-component sensor histidine kinase